MVLDSRVGALDRTLGFLFGLGRGLIIVVVAFLFFAWLVPDRSQPEWVRSAKSKVVLQNTGQWLMSMLPDDPESTILKRLKRPKPEDQDAPDDIPTSGRSSDATESKRAMTMDDRDLMPMADEAFDPDADRLREECGVFGIFGHPDAAAITALGLHALQHRGQEAAGIVSFDGKRFHSERRLRLVGDAFARREVIDRLPGTSAIGHVRYSTTGETVLRNVQPLFAELEGGGFAIGHNGDLTNGIKLRRDLVHEGAMMQSTTDTEVILHLVAVPNATASSTVSSRACASSKAPMPSSASPTRNSSAPAIRSASVRSSSETRRLSRSWPRNLCARYHRRRVRTRRRKRRSRHFR